MAGTKFAMIVRYFAGGCFTRHAVACGHPLASVMAGIVAELSLNLCMKAGVLHGCSCQKVIHDFFLGSS